MYSAFHEKLSCKLAQLSCNSLIFIFAAEACETKWKLLRDRYRRQRKLVKQNRENGKLWQFYEPLKFLDGHIRIRG